MKEQPEALRLADRLTLTDYYEFDAALHCPPAAAELRRLHASCEDYAQHKQRQDQRVLELAERVLELKAQRDALLAALKAIVSIDGHSALTEAEADEIHARACAAIKAVEENT